MIFVTIIVFSYFTLLIGHFTKIAVSLTFLTVSAASSFTINVKKAFLCTVLMLWEYAQVSALDPGFPCLC